LRLVAKSKNDLSETLENSTELERRAWERSNSPADGATAFTVVVKLRSRKTVTRQQAGSGALFCLAGLLAGEGQHGEQGRIEASGKQESRTPPNWSIATASASWISRLFTSALDNTTVTSRLQMAARLIQ
jgi:hypothetical protein